MAENGGRCSRTGGTNKGRVKVDNACLRGWRGLTARLGLTACLGVLTELQVLANAWELELEIRPRVETGAREAKAEEGWEAEQARGQRTPGGRGREGGESEADMTVTVEGKRRRDQLAINLPTHVVNAHGPSTQDPLRPAADTPLRPSGWHRREALPPSLACLHGVELVQVAHAPADRNDGPTEYESDVEHTKSRRRVAASTQRSWVKHFVYAGGPLRKTETYNPHPARPGDVHGMRDPCHSGVTYAARTRGGDARCLGRSSAWMMCCSNVTIIDTYNGFPYP
ncbi:hypothetical protein B0H11DRAFT_2182881 [Mycena galericulata]|nr:hypothetical protein B0H11DRAFT_2182881 [Mycena galericulata]